MNVKEHLSAETLKLLLNNGLSDEIRGVAGLHLSYCPICRDQKDDLALELAAHQMWEDYERVSSDLDSHIRDSTFRDFWFGKIPEGNLLDQFSHHCIVCRSCRGRRELIRAEIQNEQAPVRELTRASLLLAVLGRALRKRRRVIWVSGASLVLLLTVLRFWPNRQTLNPSGVNNAESYANVGVSPGNSRTGNRVLRNESPQLPSPQNGKTPAQQRTPPPTAPANNFLARAQVIDLKRVPDGADFRAPNSISKNHLKIRPSGYGRKRLQILLPANSKRGVYEVSIREPAFLDEIVSAEGTSSDGVSLVVLMNVSGLNADKYVLRITRRDLTTGHHEYNGDYNVLITNPGIR